jgi:hypothetical protein
MANTAPSAMAQTQGSQDGKAGGPKDTESPIPAQAVQIYDTDYPFINYSGTPIHNEIAQLQQRMDRGDVRLHYSTAHGYLESLLTALNISRSSQVLVFSKTSLQIDAISPQTPRHLLQRRHVSRLDSELRFAGNRNHGRGPGPGFRYPCEH